MSEPLLRVRDLRVALPAGQSSLELLHGVDLDVSTGETVALVGESGSGKSLTVLSVMGLLAPPIRVTSGSVRFADRDLTTLPESEMRQIRGRDIAMVYQDPMTSLNPFHRIGAQIVEGMTAHGVAEPEARNRTLEMLSKVGIPDPARAARAFPHVFSGGMRQRAVIAMALALSPKLLVADEPTTALDVTTQQQILSVVDELRRELGMTTIWVTHDLGVVARLVDRVVVMYAGRVVEDAPVRQLFARPQHPYTARLLASLPRPDDLERRPMAQIPGRPPLPTAIPSGCPFRPRCPEAVEVCAMEPALLPRGAGRVACHVPPDQWRHHITEERDGRGAGGSAGGGAPRMVG
jgi:oligopeptide/dipeptide ABC transporter ATP-binding protein